MKTTGNTILITGGGSGIGRGLAEAFHALGNQVIISGRRKEFLDKTTAANPGMKSLTLDIDDPASIGTFSETITKDHPKLNIVINNAGIMRPENLKSQPIDLTHSESIITTNLLGPIRLTAALLPKLLKQPSATVMMVTSGLAFVPLVFTPTYCATKAAIHSYTQSLRYQLKATSVEVLELAPPYVQTELMDGANDPRAMPLKDYITEVMSILKTEPTPIEICVERSKMLRFAAESGKYDAVFNGLNGAMADRFSDK
jgi:uncharacterized oxidoreductase